MDSTSGQDMAARQPPFPEGPAAGPEEALSEETLTRITGFRAGALRVVSMYLAIDPGDRASIAAEAESLLHGVRALSKDRTLDHDARVSLREDIARIEKLVENELPMQKGVAIFACAGAGLFEVIALPREAGTRVTVDAEPWVRPLLALLEEYERMIVVVVDRQEAHLWEAYLGRHRDTGRVKGPDLRKSGGGGRRANSPQHHEDKGDRLERQFFKDLAAALEHLSYDALAFGGHEDELPHLVEALPKQVSDKVIGTFAIDPSTATPAAVRERAEAILAERRHERQRALVEEVAESVAAGGPAALGLEPCLWAASVDAVDTLLVEEGAIVPGVVCDESRWLATSGEICPVCGKKTRATADVIEELVEAVIAEGGSVRHVAVETVLREHLTGAKLRFPLPPGPQGLSF